MVESLRRSHKIISFEISNEGVDDMLDFLTHNRFCGNVGYSAAYTEKNLPPLKEGIKEVRFEFDGDGCAKIGKIWVDDEEVEGVTQCAIKNEDGIYRMERNKGER